LAESLLTLEALLGILFVINRIRINNEIRANELIVIDETGNNLGPTAREEALRLAREKELDLIEVSSAAKPPVARIMSFDKFRYEQEKKLKKQKAKQRGQEMKQVQVSIREAKNDLERKARRVDEFLDEGNQVEIVLRLRGREKANRNFARERLQVFVEMIDPNHKVILTPKFGGRGLFTQVTKK
jgi:translation initiation factor IF-3